MHTTPITLLERFRRGADEGAWCRLVDLYTPLLFTWVRRAGAANHDAADLVQEVFLVLVRQLATFRRDAEGNRQGSFRAWQAVRVRSRQSPKARNSCPRSCSMA